MKLTMLLSLASLILAVFTPHAWATADDKFNGQLLKLDPITRLEQTCDFEVMDKINREHRGFNADKVVAYTFENPLIEGDAITAPGAAIRSKGEWYQLSYKCKTGPRHLDAQKLSHEIGAKIPHDEWAKYNLYD